MGDLYQLDRGINCDSQASIATRSGATRGHHWFGRSAKGTLRADAGGMRFPSFPRVQRSLTLLGALLCASCRSNGPSIAESNPASSASAGGTTTIPERAEAVARADAWAVLGSKQGGRAGAKLLLEAAQLRERIFRADHRDADALEAIELYRQAARGEPSVRCSAATSAALLEGELKADPGLTFQAVYRAGLAPGSDEACKQRAEAILNTLSAYRPLPTVLAQIDGEHSAPVPLAARSAAPPAERRRHRAHAGRAAGPGARDEDRALRCGRRRARRGLRDRTCDVQGWFLGRRQ